MTFSKRVVLRFPKALVDQVIVCHLVKDYDLEFNILKASVTPKEEGLMVLELRGSLRDYDRGIKYLADAGVEVDLLSHDVVRNDLLCTHCGACTTLCPAGAFEVDTVSRLIEFHDDKCIACGLCIKACPMRAMEVRV